MPTTNHNTERELLTEFESYLTSSESTLTCFRLEVVYSGFRASWKNGDYRTIIAVAKKLPDPVLQEDEKLLMYYDSALARLGDE